MRTPMVFFFLPLKLIDGYDTTQDNTIAPDGVGQLRLMSYPSLLSTHLPRGPTVLRTITESGLMDPGTNASNIATLEFQLCGLAMRASTLTVITIYNQGFIYDLSSVIAPSLNHYHRNERVPAPLRLELNIRQQAKSTAICVADVVIRASTLKKFKGRNETIWTNITGQHSLSLFGDSDGKINFCLCDANVAIHTDSFQAHNQALSCIVCTGDATRPTWRITAQIVGKIGN